MKLPADTWVLVCDAGKYLLLRNAGGEDILDLRIIDHREHALPATGELGTDRPGTFTGVAARRGGPDPTDWHQLSKEEHTRDLADHLYASAERGAFQALVIVSDKRSLGLLRPALSQRVLKALLAEIAADYAHHTIEDIEALLKRS